MSKRPPHSLSGYMPQLDGMRAFAVVAVLIHHFSPNDISEKFSLGHSGVQLFFVLSGFLITGILFRCREKMISAQQSGRVVLGSFYRRRFVRIFPAYYFVLLVAWLAGNSEIRQDILWHATYSSNFLIALRGDWGYSASHFWTLAVEQQFYLIWPVCILFIRKKFIPHLIVAMILCGPVFRLLGVMWGLSDIAVVTLPFSSWDSLGMGALLAWMQNKPALREKVMRIGLRMFLVAVFWKGFSLEKYFFLLDSVLIDTVQAGAFLWLVGEASRGFTGIAGRILCFSPVVYLGKISYGVYVYHLFIPLILKDVWDFSGWPHPESLGVIFVLSCLTTLAAAMLSWHMMEKPFLSLKSKGGSLGFRSSRIKDLAS